MKTIWKFAVKSNTFTVKVPRGARILDVRTGPVEPCASQGTLATDHPVILLLVDPANTCTTRKFVCAPTDDQMPGRKHIGTFQVEKGDPVFKAGPIHVFDLGEGA